MARSSRVSRSASWIMVAGVAVGCGSVVGNADHEVETTGSALTAPQACVTGTNGVRIAQRVTTSGGLAANGLAMESGSVVNGGANINNVNGATVRISGATINGTVFIAGAAPSAANGELVNGGSIRGTVVTGAGQQSTLPTSVVIPGTTPVAENGGSPPQSLAPGSYGTVAINGSRLTLSAGTYSLASLTVNAGSVVFDTSGGPIVINVQGSIWVNGGTFTAGNPALVSLYSNGNVTVNAGITTLPATIVAPNGTVTIGSRITVQGCVGGRNVNLEPDSKVSGTGCVSNDDAGCGDAGAA